MSFFYPWVGRIASGFAIVVIAGLELGGCSPGSGEEFNTSQRLQEQADGATIFRENCSACHGAQGEGLIAPPLNQTGHAHHHSDDDLLLIVTKGIRSNPSRYPIDMPSWQGKLSPREIKLVLSYIKSLWTEEQRQFQAALSQQQ